MTQYVTNGKQVLGKGNCRVADASDIFTAELIAAALNAYIPPAMRLERPTDKPIAHIVRREMDEYACSCSTRWYVAEGDEHP